MKKTTTTTIYNAIRAARESIGTKDKSIAIEEKVLECAFKVIDQQTMQSIERALEVQNDATKVASIMFSVENPIPKTIAIELAETFQQLTNLQVLSISNFPLSSETAPLLEKVIDNNPQLKHFSFPNEMVLNHPADIDAQEKELSTLLPHLNNASNINFSHRNLHGLGSSLRTLLETGNVTKLRLTNCGLDDTDMKEIESALKSSHSIVELSMNPISEDLQKKLKDTYPNQFIYDRPAMKIKLK